MTQLSAETNELSLSAADRRCRINASVTMQDGSVHSAEIVAIRDLDVSGDYHIRILLPGDVSVKEVTVEAHVPMVDLHHLQISPLPGCVGQIGYLNVPWTINEPVSSHNGLPFIAGYSRHNVNRFFLGALDQVADATVWFKHPYFRSALAEGSGWFRYIRQFPDADAPAHLDFFISLSESPWEQALQRYVGWHDEIMQPNLPPLPEGILEPVWTSYYEYGYRLTQEDMLRDADLMADLGIGIVVTDAGWNLWEGITPETVLDYCGETLIDSAKFPDLAGLSRALRSKGLKNVLWCSPSWIGKKVSHRETHKHLLGYVDGVEQESFDPRLKEAQDFMTELMGRFMREYDLDGLKIDFLDPTPHLKINPASLDLREGFDYTTKSVAVAMQNCMVGMADAIWAEKPDAIIEYRQNYTNLATRLAANAFRSQDSPHDPDHIRRMVILLRLTCPGVAIWADPGYWHQEETPVNVARFLGGMILFSVPHFAQRFSNYPQEHLDLIKIWLRFYQRHKLSIHEGKIRLLSEDPCMPNAANISDKAIFVGHFSSAPVSIALLADLSSRPVYVVNGTAASILPVDLPGWGTMTAIVRNHRLEEVSRKDIADRDTVEVLPGGMLELHPKS